MRNRTVLLTICFLLTIFSAIISTTNAADVKEQANNQWRWDFNKFGDREGWEVPEPMTGSVYGGALWLSIVPKGEPLGSGMPIHEQNAGRWSYNNPWDRIRSPNDLAIPASKVKKVKLRILNLSPENDGYLLWKTVEKSERRTGTRYHMTPYSGWGYPPEDDAGQVRFAMKSYLNQWQDIVCHVDDQWGGTIDQISIAFSHRGHRGDIWIDSIVITDGPNRPPLYRPDVCSVDVVPQINIPGISQEDFHDAFKVLDECLVINVPAHGFPYPFMAPGGGYGDNWWVLDTSMNTGGAKWTNPQFAENVFRGFSEVQSLNVDGRIDAWGASTTTGAVGDHSQIPRYFEYAYDIARRTEDKQLRELIYKSMMTFMDWFLSPTKRDSKSGLVTACYEETFGGAHPGIPLTHAALDLNVAIAVGCQNIIQLANNFGYDKDVEKYQAVNESICSKINQFMWNEDNKAYYSYDVVKNEQFPLLNCATFDPLRHRIAPPDRVKPLLNMLTDPKLFNWGHLPVTTIAKTDPIYKPDGWWSGPVWEMRNLPIIIGLEDIGRHDLAANLAWQTASMFSGNYCEFLNSSTGQGLGTPRYGWTSSLYIQTIVEHIFGIDYDCLNNRLRIVPHIPQELMGQEISISKLILPTGGDTRLNLKINQTQPAEALICLDIEGELPEGIVTEILLPRSDNKPTKVLSEQGHRLQLVENSEGVTNAVGVHVPISKSIRVRFE